MSKNHESNAAVVLTTLGADADAATLARTLVDERLAACVNILPAMTSVYRWKGSTEQEREQQLVIKTSVDRIEALQVRLRELHPYELPEFLVLEASGSEAYLEWIHREVGEAGEKSQGGRGDQGEITGRSGRSGRNHREVGRSGRNIVS